MILDELAVENTGTPFGKAFRVEGHQGLVPRPSDAFGQDLGHHRLIVHHQDSHDRHGITILTGARRSKKKVSRPS